MTSPYSDWLIPVEAGVRRARLERLVQKANHTQIRPSRPGDTPGSGGKSKSFRTIYSLCCQSLQLPRPLQRCSVACEYHFHIIIPTQMADHLLFHQPFGPHAGKQINNKWALRANVSKGWGKANGSQCPAYVFIVAVIVRNICHGCSTFALLDSQVRVCVGTDDVLQNRTIWSNNSYRLLDKVWKLLSCHRVCWLFSQTVSCCEAKSISQPRSCNGSFYRPYCPFEFLSISFVYITFTTSVIWGWHGPLTWMVQLISPWTCR